MPKVDYNRRWGLAKRVRHWAERRALILVYHRISERTPDPWSLNVSPEHFSQQLEILNRRFPPLNLRELVDRLTTGKPLPYRSSVITFDDGYRDNLYVAKPLLEHYQLPATIFITTGVIDNPCGFWWDRLEFILQPGSLPHELVLSVDGRTLYWRLDGASNYREEDCPQYRYWKAHQEPPSPRHALFRSLWNLLHSLTPLEQQRVLDQLHGWAGRDDEMGTIYPTLSSQEVAELLQGGGIEIGAHTVTHASLAYLPKLEQRSEILDGKNRLEKILKLNMTSFAYPFGKQGDFSAQTINLVKEAGFKSGSTFISGCVTSRTDPFQLPRVQVYNMDGETFDRWLDRKFLL